MAAPQPFGEEIVITGTRIRRTELLTPAPVQVVTRQQLIDSGRASVGDAVQLLPAQANALNTQYNNGGDGSVRVNLRGLGDAPRTLVLLNGRRFVAGGRGADGAVDLTTIPAAAVERIEVLKDGASAIYGSDAIGGVVNIITRRSWQGTEANVYYGASQRGDGNVLDASVTSGVQRYAGKMLISLGFYDQQPVWRGDREWSKTDHVYDFSCTPERSAAGECVQVSTTGSSSTPDGYFRFSGDPEGNDAFSDLRSQHPGKRIFTTDDGGWRPFSSAGIEGGPEGGDLYNYQPFNYLVTPSRRVSALSVGSYRLGERAQLYYEAAMTSRTSSQLQAPEPLQLLVIRAVASKENRYNPFGVDWTDIRRRLVESGNRRTEQDVATFRVVAGASGSPPPWLGFASGWSWDLSVNHGRTTANQLTTGSLQASHVAAAIGPTYLDAGGKLRCGTAESPGPAACVPLNLFGGAGSITPEMVRWLTFTGSAKGYNEMTALSASLVGDLVRLAARRPMSFALGYELRHEAGAYIPDPVTAAGDTTGTAVAATEGGYHANEGFLELSVPVLSGRTGADDLELSAAVRAFDYSTFGGGVTWKLGGRYRPVRDVTLRGTFSTAFRAPSVTELYWGDQQRAPYATDPCSTLDTKGKPRTVSATAAARCAAEGATDVQDDRSQQLSVVAGNPELQPEEATTFTVGVVVEPRLVRGLALTLDWYRIDLDQTIVNATVPVILQSCYEAAAPQYCNRVHRGSTGLLSSVDDPLVNIGGLSTDGLDLGARFERPTAIGAFGASLDLTWTRTYVMQFAGGRKVDGVGIWDLSASHAPVVFAANARWNREGWDAGVTGRFVSNQRECRDNACEVPEGTAAPPSRDIGAYFTADAHVSYRLASPAGTTGLRLGVNNLLDAEPRTVYGSSWGKTDPSRYDFLGRYFYVRLSHTL